FTFTTNLMFFTISPVRLGPEADCSRNKVLPSLSWLQPVLLCSVGARSPRPSLFQTKCLCKARKEVPAALVFWHRAHMESHPAKTRRKADMELPASAVWRHRSQALSAALREVWLRLWRIDRPCAVLRGSRRRGYHPIHSRSNF